MTDKERIISLEKRLASVETILQQLIEEKEKAEIEEFGRLLEELDAEQERERWEAMW